MAFRLSHILTKWRSKNRSPDLLLCTLAMTTHGSKAQTRGITFCALRLLHKQKTNFHHMYLPFRNNARILLKLPLAALQSSNSHLAETFLIQSRCMQQIVNQDSNKGTFSGFKNSDICVVTDDKDVQIAKSTFEEAKNLASTKKSRLVFIRKNADGSMLFKLQALANTNTESMTKRDTVSVRKEKVQKKQVKSTSKEFTLKASITEHDFETKIRRMHSLIVKNKTVVVLIKAGSDKDKNASYFLKKLKESLGDVCKVRQDFSHETMTRYTLTPMAQENASPES